VLFRFGFNTGNDNTPLAPLVRGEEIGGSLVREGVFGFILS